MRYQNAREILPNELLEILQQYAQGICLYIPKRPENRLFWGEHTQSRRDVAERNRRIFLERQAEASVEVLAGRFFLSEKSVGRILREERKRETQVKKPLE